MQSAVVVSENQNVQREITQYYMTPTSIAINANKKKVTGTNKQRERAS